MSFDDSACPDPSRVGGLHPIQPPIHSRGALIHNSGHRTRNLDGTYGPIRHDPRDRP